MNIKLNKEAREFVLFQRTNYLPKMQLSFLERVFDKLKLQNNYKNFVKKFAEESKEDIDKQYSKTMDSLSKFIFNNLPSNVSSILDIGCGIGGVDIYLYHLLNKPKIHLLDENKVERKIWYMFEKKGAFYNSLNLSKEILVKNSVRSQDINLIIVPKNGNINVIKKSIDLVISNISWGYHYPVDVYIDSVSEALSDKGCLIIDIRKNTGGEEKLKKYFKINPIKDTNKYITYKCIK